MSVFLQESKNIKTTKDHWQSLRVLLTHSPVAAASLMRSPCPALLPDADIFKKTAALAETHGLKILLLKHLCSCLALPGKHANSQSHTHLDVLLNENKNENENCQNVPAEDLLRADWTSVPILVCQGKTVSTIWFLMGYLPGETSQPRSLFSPHPAPESMTAVHSAFIAARTANPHIQGGGYFFSLQDEQEPPITGPSLGLPFGIAMCELREKRGWPDNCYATGELSATGQILPVSKVTEKFSTVEKTAHLFLYPEHSLSIRSDDSAVSCATLQDSLFALHMFAGGESAGRIDLYRACLRDGHLLLSNYHELPQHFFVLSDTKELLASMGRKPALFLPAMARALAGSVTAGQQAGKPLACLLSPEQIARTVAEDNRLAFDAFKWVIGRISFANHSGDVSDIRAWYALADQLRDEITDEEFFIYLNHRFVGERFNRFDFQPELPDDLAGFIQLEEERNNISPRENRALGAVYGTIAQNYGFCGPDYFDDLCHYTKHAAAAFGRKFKKESIRLQAYRIYALLDAEKFDQAGKVLDTYLDLPENSSRQQRLQQTTHMLRTKGMAASYHAAVTIRFIADTLNAPLADTEERELNALTETALLHRHHPWQLIALNLGRIHTHAGRRESAHHLFRHGLSICSAGDETMQVMSFLFLSELHRHGFAEQKDYSLTENLVKLTLDSTLFNSSHFATIHQAADAGEILELVSAARNTLFPFSYR